jgi:hypothetical protein
VVCFHSNNFHQGKTDTVDKGLDDDDDIVMVGGDEDTASPEKSSRDRKGKSKVIADPIFKNAPPPPPAVPPGDEDLPIRRNKMPFTKESSANARYVKQAKQEDDIVMVDAGGPSEKPGLKRSDSSAKRAGIGGMFGGLLSKSRPDNKRRNTALTDDEGRSLRREDRKIKRPANERSEGNDVDRNVTMSGGAAEEDQEARREARRARRAEREAAEKAAEDARRAKDEERRERRRKQEEEMEARRQEEKEARRAARREQRAREDAEREAAAAKEAERAERRRARRAEREATQTDGEEPVTDDPGRLKRPDRRKSHMDDDEERRQRHEQRRRNGLSEAPRTSRRMSAPVVDSYFDPRNGSKSRNAGPEFLPADGPVYKDSRRKKEKAGWPHSGTDSWVKDHSDAPPPPEDAPPADDPADDPTADENARRNLRKTRRHSKYDDGAGDQEERRRRRESRRREKEVVRSSEGSQGDDRRSSRRDSVYINASRAPSAQGGLFSRFKRLAGV